MRAFISAATTIVRTAAAASASRRSTTVLKRYRDVRVIIELKLNDAALARAVIDVVRAQDAVDRVCLGSFGLRVLRAARTIAPQIATSAAREEVRWALYRSWLRWPVSRVAYGGYQIPGARGLDPRGVPAFRRRRPTAPVSPSRSGRLTRRPTPAACWRGASTR